MANKNHPSAPFILGLMLLSQAGDFVGRRELIVEFWESVTLNLSNLTQKCNAELLHLMAKAI